MCAWGAEAPGERLEGMVQEWSERGFGFVTFMDGRRAYVHHSSLLDSQDGARVNLSVGEYVTAVQVEDRNNPGKWAATEVVRKASCEAVGVQARHAHGIVGVGAGYVDNLASSGGILEGTVLEWNPRGFGFIGLADQRRAYVHASQLDSALDGSRDLVVGEPVYCVLAEDAKNPGKWQAMQVRRSSLLGCGRGGAISSGAPVMGGGGEEGSVSQWNASGYGFLDMDDGRKAYIHSSSFGGGDLMTGTRLRVVTRPDSRNLDKWCVSEVLGEVTVVPSGPPQKMPRTAAREVWHSGAATAPQRGVASQLVPAEVISWDPRGFGFVLCDGDGCRAYVHGSAFSVGGERVDLSVGERVRVAVSVDQRDSSKFAVSSLVRLTAGSEGAQDGDWLVGTVSDWRDDSGFGFVTLEDGRRAYVHHSTFGGGGLTHGHACKVTVSPDRVNPGKWMVSSIVGDELLIQPLRDEHANKRCRT